MKTTLTFFWIGLGFTLVVGCSTNMAQRSMGGAAAGAASASFVGVVTDLILDGKVDTDRLARNAVSGAVGGATAGAAVGHRQDRQQAQQQTQQQARDEASAAKPDLIAKIGKENYQALNDLLHYRHPEAYRHALSAAKSKDATLRDTGLAIQALIDQDRGNEAGMQESIETLIAVSTKVTSEAAARDGLNKLHEQLQDERKVQGIRR